MAELTTIARPYAEAAFRLARDENALGTWSAMLRLVTEVVANREMAGALDNPRLTAGGKEALVLSVCGDKLNPLGRNFVRVLIEADRIAVLPQIGMLFDTLKDEAEGTAKARIDTAFALSEAQLGELKAALETHFGKKIDATVNIDPALIGGARITVGDTVIDGTVEAQLASMANRLRA